jgi:hypothetical protein
MEYLECNPEYQEELFKELPEKITKIFKEKLSLSMSQYWKTLAEARAVAIFFKKLGLVIEGIDVKTTDKNVDFLADFKGEKFYIEVKGFDPDKETSEEHSTLVINTEDNDIDRALRRADHKFLENCYNIVVIADEDILHPQGNEKPENIGKIFNADKYKKISALIILGPLWANDPNDLSSDPLKPSHILLSPAFKFTAVIYNQNTQKPLPNELRIIFDNNKYPVKE